MQSRRLEQPARSAMKLARAGRPLAFVVVAIVAASLIAACGGGGKSPDVANVKTTTTGSTTSSTAQNDGSGAIGGDQAPSPSGRDSTHSSFAIAGGNRQNGLKLSACMRANGEPNFPDPDANGVISGQNLNPTSPQFQNAMRKCRKYTPNGGKPPSPAQQQQAFERALAFSKCMRAHGVTQFPDPQDLSGGIRISLRANGNSTLDPNSPIFQHAQQACGSLGGPKQAFRASSSGRT
jgi:hypothetical protein